MSLKLFKDVSPSKETSEDINQEGSPKIDKSGVGNQLSICELINSSKDLIEQKIFLINYGGNAESSNRYVQIKLKKFHMNHQEKQMLQIIDVSASILYDQQKAENSFLALINACVSHELRNPLNSIIA